MHLKKICINGFKSFADKVELVIDRGVTGIVGPNGSGKSNVIDSVRWVMGEQNAKTLRGEKGTDIIFAGSTARKSLSMAEVSLVFDNSDPGAFCPPEYQHDEEITLTRRIYGDGQRDYLINGKPCRLKDIVGFFTSTGLGGRSYSMIQQGQVDRILNAKPEDVREILEEAAGTTVFKSRRLEAERRLVSTSENLSRVEDILREIDKQKKSLKAQADKARIYKDTAVELKTRELSLLGHNFVKYESERVKHQEVIDRCGSEDAGVLKAIAELEQQYEELQAKLSEADPHLRDLQERIARVREDIARAENTMTNSETKVAEYKSRLAAISEELVEDQKVLEVVDQQFNAAQSEVETAISEASILEEQIAAVQSEVDQTDEGNQVLKSKLEDFLDEISNIQRLTQNNIIRKENSQKEIQELIQAKKDAQQRIEMLEEDFTELRILLDAAQVRVASERKGLDKDLFRKQTLSKEIEENRIKIKQINAELGTAKESYVGTKTRLQSLVEMQAQASGCSAAHAALKAAGLDEAYLGMLSDLIEFKLESFSELSSSAQVAIEKWSERLIVRDFDQFHSLISAARDLKLGDFSVSVATDQETKPDFSEWRHFQEAQPLLDIIKIKKHREHVSKIFHNLYYYPSIVLDASVVSSMPTDMILFTASGAYMQNGGHQAFVVQTDQENGYFRLHEKIEQLQKQLKINEQEVVRLKGEADQLDSQISRDSAELQEIDTLLQSQNKDVLAVMTEFESLRQQEEYKTDLLNTAKQNLEQLLSKEESLQAEIVRIVENNKSLEVELKNAQDEMERVEEQLEELEEQKKNIWQGHGDKRIELARKQARSQALQEGYNQTKLQLERLQNNLNKKFEEKSKLESGIEQAEINKNLAEEDIRKLVLDREALENDYSQKREANADILEEQRTLDSHLRKARENAAEVQRRLNDSQIKVERAVTAQQSIIEQANEKYQLSISEYEFDLKDDYDFDGETKEVSRLRQKLERVGPINMMAIEEFDALSERETFILKQREEILKSIELIQQAISEIELTSRDKFLVVFHTVNEEFGSLFPILFPTGEAHLKLSNPEDPLTSGVEIMCRLPGKKLQRLSLFSGGEKALTAIALIFALLKTKPTPFCFLDEVDAPLDEANVVRYNKVLTALSKRFQFIIITHNRRTMEILDTLYGVTMQEPGVSKVVGVDMSKDIPTHLQSAFKKSPEVATIN